MQIDKQTIKLLNLLTLPSFLKNDEQTNQAGFKNIFNALANLYLKIKNAKKFWPVQNFIGQNQLLVKNSGQNLPENRRHDD